MTYAGTRTAAARLIADKGQDITLIRREAGDYDIATASAAINETAQNAKGVVLPLSPFRKASDSNIIEGDRQLLLSALDSSGAPLDPAPRTDDIAIDASSNLWTLTAVDPLAPDGTDILYDCVARGGLPAPLPDPIVLSDFKNGTYTLNGSAVAFEDLWYSQFGFPTGLGTVVPGVGYTTSQNGGDESFYDATPAVWAALDPLSGFTVVLDMSVDAPDVLSGRSCGGGLYIQNWDALTQIWGLSTNWDPPFEENGGPQIVVSYVDAAFNQGPTKFVPTGGAVRRSAASLGPDALHLAVEGEFVGSSTAVLGPDLNELYMQMITTGVPGHVGTATVVIERVSLYALQPPSMLPRLSA